MIVYQKHILFLKINQLIFFIYSYKETKIKEFFIEFLNKNIHLI